MTDMRLIMPSYVKYQEAVQPLGLYYIKAYLEENGYRVAVNDTNIEPLNFGNEEVVGVYVSTFLFGEAKKIIGRAKEKSKLVVCGGPHVWSDADSLATLGVDALVEGDGEYAALEMMKDVDKGFITPHSHPVFPHLYRRPVSDLDSLPFPKHVRYRTGGRLSTSRGCPYECLFCSVRMMGRKWRPRRPEKVVEEMALLDGQDIDIIDDLFTFDARRLEQIQEFMRKEKLAVSISLGNGTRVDQVDYRRLVTLRKMNCIRIAYGVENINDDILVAVKKHTNRAKIEEAINLTAKIGIPEEVFMIIGLPLDTYQKTMRCLAWVQKQNLKAYWNVAVPYPRTELFDWVDKNGRWLIDKKDYTQYGGHFGRAMKILWDTESYPSNQRIKAFKLVSRAKRHPYLVLGKKFLQITDVSKEGAYAMLEQLRSRFPYRVRKLLLGIDERDYLTGRLKLGDES